MTIHMDWADINRNFAHLHLHTDRSLLDGVGRPGEYAEIAADMGQRAMGITDHGQLYGVPEHRKVCMQHGVKPIPGCEVYVNDTRDETREVKKKAKLENVPKGALDPTFTDSHLIVLAINNTGWKNLLRINHDSVRNGYYYKPRTTHDIVCEHAAGLVATTACMNSLFSQYALRGELDKLKKLLAKFKDAFGDRFFYEIQFNELDEQKKINHVLSRQCKRMGIKPILTQDVHYACGCDVPRQDEMICIARRSELNAKDAFRLTARHLYFSTPQEIYTKAREWGYVIDREEFKQACYNTMTCIGGPADVDIYNDGGKLLPPKYINDLGTVVEDGFAHLKKLAIAGMKSRLSTVDDPSKYKARLVYELQVIRKCNMSDFYLVTLDVVNECRKREIMVWTRGSGCASLVAALVGITSIDPLRFGLLFERFVDVERANAPDFDLDIDSNRRDEIVEWLYNKYGGTDNENIARIIALTTMGLRSAIRDVCFVHGIPSNIAFGLSGVVDSLDKEIEKELQTCSVADRDKVIKKSVAAIRAVAPSKYHEFIDTRKDIMSAALTMVGRTIRKTLHAAGYVVAPGPLVNYVPIDRAKESSSGEPVITTAWGEGQAVQEIADTGLMKLDLLSLETVGVVNDIVTIVAARQERSRESVYDEIDPWKMDYADTRVLKEFASGNGIGLHQLNNTDQSLASLCAKIQPKSVDDVIAAIALYRPGSTDFLDIFIKRIRSDDRSSDFHRSLDPIVSDTYGVIVYQEQIMRILHDIGGVPLRKAYTIIKAISKKKKQDIESAREKFIEYASKHNGFQDRDAEYIFDVVEKWAGYGFNKAHAASYGTLSWITAYLRSRYPTEFWLAWLNRTPNQSANKASNNQTRKIEMMMRAASRSGIRLIRPTVGYSSSRWRIMKSGALLAPLSFVKGVGDKAADTQHAAFKENRWGDIFDFLRWCESSSRVVNAGQVKSIAMSGALHTIEPNTNRAVALCEKWAAYKTTKKNGSRTDQLLDNDDSNTQPEHDESECMDYELQAHGFNFWHDAWMINNRMAKVELAMKRGRVADASDRSIRGRRRPLLLSSMRKFKDKNKRDMAFLAMQSPSGEMVRVVCFSNSWKHVNKKQLKVGRCYLASGEFQRDGSFILSGSGSPLFDIDNM